MSRLVILCVEDEPEVRMSLARDIAAFAPAFLIEETEDAAEAREVVQEVLGRGDRLALVLCDHLLPGERGVDFLVALKHDPQTRAARKVLVTGQAGLEDTIKAVNEAGLDYYVSKPWSKPQLEELVRSQLTEFVLRNVEDVLPYVAVLDGARLMEAVKNRGRVE
ncbi:MAG: response regulator [Phycisphaerae bacterium]|nr:response regulator [Phycisphaerae bacterium]